MKVLCHVCCAPCAIGPFATLRAEGHQVAGSFYNPNIHPLLEFRRRLKALKLLAERGYGPMVYDEQYGLEPWLAAACGAALAAGCAPEPAARCESCYRLRLGHTARLARERGDDAFTTTLFVSAHQDHERVRRVAEEAAAEHGAALLYRDFRPLAAAAHEQAARWQLYRQNYCGCIFSENERFRDTTRFLYPPADAQEGASPGGTGVSPVPSETATDDCDHDLGEGGTGVSPVPFKGANHE